MAEKERIFTVRATIAVSIEAPDPEAAQSAVDDFLNRAFQEDGSITLLEDSIVVDAPAAG